MRCSAATRSRRGGSARRAPPFRSSGASASWRCCARRRPSSAAGQGGTVALIGPEGSGKSRLLAELARAPELAGARLLQIQCVQLDRASPGRAAAELASRVLGRDVASFEEVGKALPEIFEATSRRPHVLALEDAHVLDHDALALIEALLAGLARAHAARAAHLPRHGRRGLRAPRRGRAPLGSALAGAAARPARRARRRRAARRARARHARCGDAPRG